MAKRYEDMQEHADDEDIDLLAPKGCRQLAKDALDMQLMTKPNNGKESVLWQVDCCNRTFMHKAKGDALSFNCSHCGVKAKARRVQSRIWTRWVLSNFDPKEK